MRDMPPTETIDRSDRQGSIALVVLLTVLLVGAAVSSYWLDDERRSVYMVWFLALLAAIGLVAMLMYAVGILQFSTRAMRNDLTKRIVDTAGEGVVAVDKDGKVIYANAAYVGLAGMDAGEARLVERAFSGAPEVTEAVYRLAKAAREGRTLVEEVRMSPALGAAGEGGEAAWYKIRVRPLERDGKPLALWTVSDRTREREKQENVYQELQHAIDYLDHAPAGFLSAAPDGKIAYINATLAGWLDLDIAQFSPGGLTLPDIVSGDGAALLAGAAGTPGTVTTETIDLDLKRPNGRTLPARLHHSVAFAADGTRGASRTLVLNRSPGAEPAEAAEGLRAAEVRFARFFNSTPLAIATVEGDGRITRANAPFARTFPDGSSAGHARDIFDAVAEGERAELKTALDAARAGRGDIAPLDLRLAGPQARSARFFISPVDESASGDGSAIVYALETTEQQKLQEQFFQAQKMNAIGQLAGGVAHDFNNHLQSILGFADLLLASHKPTDASFADIVQIKNSANRAKSLVRQLLAFSRQQTLTPEEIHIGARLSELSNMLKRSIGPKVELDLKYARDLWPVHADPASFDNMIINLAVNARDAMPGGGRLTVRTKNVTGADMAKYDTGLSADCALIEVEDTGSGIAPDVLEKIFEPFFTTKEVGRGTGLGLSSAYGFVQQSGGVIRCASTVGKGTTFRIFLPRYQAKASDAPQAVATGHGAAARIETALLKPQPPAAADLTGHGVIMLVEDEEAVRNFAARALASRGYTVLQAPSGAEGLELAKGRINDIDLVVSDVVMPEMDGPTMLGELRKLNPKLKVIFVSGYAEEAFRKNLPEGEQFNFLPKPFSLKQLVETVKTVISE